MAIVAMWHTCHSKRLRHHACFGIPQMHSYVSNEGLFERTCSLEVIEKAWQGIIYRRWRDACNGQIDRVKLELTGAQGGSAQKWHSQKMTRGRSTVGSIRPRPRTTFFSLLVVPRFDHTSSSCGSSWELSSRSSKPKNQTLVSSQKKHKNNNT